MNHLNAKCMSAYIKQYPNDDCGYNEPGAGVMLGPRNSAKHYLQPESETSESFMNRLKRSEVAGRNLFYEEWTMFEYDPDSDY